MAAAGQLWATLTDLGRFGAFLLGDTGDVLDPGDARGDDRAGRRGLLRARAGRPTGSALQVLRVDGRTLVGHGGSMPGFLAGVFVDREEQTGAVSLANTTAGLDPLVFGLLADLRTAEPRIVERVGALAVARCRWTGSASGSGGRRRTCCARSAAGCCTSARCPGRIGRASRFTAAGRRHVGRAGRLLRGRDAAHRRGPPRPRHVRLHPHPLRPRGAGARRRGRARLALGRSCRRGQAPTAPAAPAASLDRRWRLTPDRGQRAERGRQVHGVGRPCLGPPAASCGLR